MPDSSAVFERSARPAAAGPALGTERRPQRPRDPRLAAPADDHGRAALDVPVPAALMIARGPLGRAPAISLVAHASPTVRDDAARRASCRDLSAPAIPPIISRVVAEEAPRLSADWNAIFIELAIK